MLRRNERESPYESPFVPYVWKSDGVERADQNRWYQRRLLRASYIRDNTDYWRTTTLSAREILPILLPQTDVKYGPVIMGAIFEGIRKPTPNGQHTIFLDRGGSPTFLACLGDGVLNSLDSTRVLAKQHNNPLTRIPDGLSEIPTFERRARMVIDRMRQRNIDIFIDGILPKDVDAMVGTTADSLDFWLGQTLGLNLRRKVKHDGSVTLFMPFNQNVYDVYDRIIGWPKDGSHWGPMSVFTFGPRDAPKTLEFDLSSFQATENPAIRLFQAQVRAMNEHNSTIDAFNIYAKPEPTTIELARPNTRAGRYVDTNQNVAQRWLPDGRVMIPPRRDIIDSEARQPLDALEVNSLGQIAEKWTRLFRRYVMRSAYVPEEYPIASRFPESSPHTMSEMTEMAAAMRRMYDEGQRIEPGRQLNIDTDIATAFQHNFIGAQIAAWRGTGGFDLFKKIFPNAPLGNMRIGMPKGSFSSDSTAVVYSPTTNHLDWESGIRLHNMFAESETEERLRECLDGSNPPPSWKQKRGSPLAQLLHQFSFFGG